MAGMFDDLIPAAPALQPSKVQPGVRVPSPGQMQVFATGAQPSSPFEDLVPGGRKMSPAATAADMAQSAVTGAQRGATGLVGLPGDAAETFLKMFGKNLVTPDTVSSGGLDAVEHNLAPLTSPSLNAARQRFAGPDHVPQTTGGRYAESVGSFAPGALLGPEGLAPRALGVMAPAIASEAAGEATQGTAWEPWARTGAALAAGGAVGLPFAPSGADKAILAATRDMTPEQIEATQALRQTGARAGFVPTVAEAAQASTNNRTPLLAKLQQLVEQNPQTDLYGKMAGRLSDARTALADVMDGIAPPTSQPSLIGQQAQAAAKSAIGNLESQRTALVTPDYTAAGPVTVSPEGMNSLMSWLDGKISGDKTGVISGPLGKVRDMLTDPAATDAASQTASASSPTIRQQVEQAWNQLTGEGSFSADPAAASAPSRVPLLDVENLNRARQWLRDNAASQLGRTLTPEQASAMGGVSDRLDQLMTDASPDYANGNAAYADFTRSAIDPVQAGPLGKLTATDQLGGQTRALFPTAPTPGQAAETGSAMDFLRDQGNADLAASLARAHLGQTADEAMQDMINGPNLYGPAKWAAGIAGNQGQRDALMAGVTSAAGPDAASQLGDLLDVFGATGRRLPATPADDASFAMLTPTPVGDLEGGVGLGVGKEAFGPAGLLMPIVAKGAAKTLDWLNQMRANANAQGIADALTGPADQTASAIFDPRSAQAQADAMTRQMFANALIAPQDASGNQ